MSEPYEAGDTAYRSEVLGRIRSAVRPRVPTNPERTQATIEALCATAATTFLAQHQIPFSSQLAGEAMSAAYNGLIAWLEAHEQRN